MSCNTGLLRAVALPILWRCIGPIGYGDAVVGLIWIRCAISVRKYVRFGSLSSVYFIVHKWTFRRLYLEYGGDIALYPYIIAYV